MRTKYGVMLAIFGYILFFFCMEGWGADWRLLGKTSIGDHYYDAESIIIPSKGIVRVVEKVVLSEKGRLAAKKYTTENVTYSLVEYEIDCSNPTTLHTIWATAYAQDDSPISGIDYRIDYPTDVTPDPHAEALYEKVCK